MPSCKLYTVGPIKRKLNAKTSREQRENRHESRRKSHKCPKLACGLLLSIHTSSRPLGSHTGIPAYFQPTTVCPAAMKNADSETLSGAAEHSKPLANCFGGSHLTSNRPLACRG